MSVSKLIEICIESINGFFYGVLEVVLLGKRGINKPFLRLFRKWPVEYLSDVVESYVKTERFSLKV